MGNRTRIAGWILAAFAAWAALAQAQSTPPPPDADTQPEHLQVQSQLVFVPTSVEFGKDHETLYDLKPSQFLVEDNGVPQQVRLDDTDDLRPLSLVVVVQCSRSAIDEFEKLRGLPTMIDALIGAAPAEVAVIQFGTGEQLLAGFTHTEAIRDEALSRIAPCDDDGGANIFDAVDYANTVLTAHHAAGRRAILLISETRDHGSETKAETVIHELGRSNTMVDAMAFSPERDEMVDDLHYGGGAGILPLLLSAIQAARRNAPKEFADLSGGEYINFRTQKAFDHGLDIMANHVHNFYLLSFVPHFPPDAAGSGVAAPGLHKITVKIPDFPKAIIRHRESYWAEDPSAAPSPVTAK